MAHPETARDTHNDLQRQYYETRERKANHRIMVRSTPYVTNQLEKLLQVSGITPTDRILDVGCGMGKYTIPLAERGYDVEGLELSGKLLEEMQAQAQGRADVTTHQADLLAPPPEMIGQYDHVIGFFVLHHLFDLEQAFASCARLLKPKGRVIFLEPNPFCPLFYMQITLSPTMSWKAERGILDLTPRKTAQRLQSVGFVNPQLHRFGILPPGLRNRPGAATLERGFDRITPFNSVAAFQLISAELPGGAAGSA
ncbi:3-demethylubiquinone-9 3-methyltransferase [Phaeobacter sp. CECT 5382]|uniref:class I SAM-dependent methyltransferase n=1 Tax=Phaeobacter sp. CECT 5382 TaxID=1712645 RepID=UPI0006DA8987|nr:class I SAM-dependent methyltransferase [Phaeobacter sp. CECT 5382]CUH88196.1 3-demethylubiquinone-9 3-methyltransferase [Phaeobacter sp. CECT 5382]